MSLDKEKFDQAWIRLPVGLRTHMERVSDISIDIGQYFGLNTEKLDLAARAHDIARNINPISLLKEARMYNIPINPIENALPMLLHGPAAAQWLRREIGVDDPDILEAVHWHSTGTINMSPTAKTILLADKLDEKKARRYPGIEHVAVLAKKSLDEALLAFFNIQFQELAKKSLPIHPSSLEARNSLLFKTAAT